MVKKNPNANILHASLEQESVETIRRYADEHGVSFSEAMGLVFDRFLEDDELELKHKVPKKRVTFWMAPEKYQAFSEKVRQRATTFSVAVDSVLKKYL